MDRSLPIYKMKRKRTPKEEVYYFQKCKERNDQTSERHGVRRNPKKRQPESIRRSGQRRRADLCRVVSQGEAAREGPA